jgi:stringent starvation protein B
MKSTKPYLIRAFYEWIVDSGYTPYVVVNADLEQVMVPVQYVDNGQIVLNISGTAVQHLALGNDAIDFNARFSGISHNIHVPIPAVLAIYAKENGRGMVFAEETNEHPNPNPPNGPFGGPKGGVKAPQKPTGTDKDKKGGSGKGKGGRGGHLTVVK